MKIQSVFTPGYRILTIAATPIIFGFFSTYAAAQTSTSADDKSASAPDKPAKLDAIVVTGNPLKSGDALVPVSVLTGAELTINRGTTLGETLNGTPGVSTSFFGPNASRPVIRGLDGDRVRILSNSGGSLDASNISFDHNPAIDPLAVERIEVLRGPAAMLYGGTAIGGVVNVIDNRIPKTAINGFGGAIEARAGGAQFESSVSGLLEAGNGQFALHADAFDRQTENYRVPTAAGLGDRIVNSASKGKGGALGMSMTLPNGYVGLAQTDYKTVYGTVAEEDVTIDMRQQRTAIEGEFSNLPGLFDSLVFRLARIDYRHAELEGDEVGTQFSSKGNSIRVEAKQPMLLGWRGIAGIQGEKFNFSALGDEAFVPDTRTRNTAAFIHEERELDRWKLSVGARFEQSRVESDGAGAASIARFGAAENKRFNLTSFSSAVGYQLNTELSMKANIARSQRAPAFYELFANGPHIATAAYEVGDRTLRRESSRSVDIGFQWKWGGEKKSSIHAGFFENRFTDFIALRRTDVDRDTEGNRFVDDCGDGTSIVSGCSAEILPEFAYQGVRARLRGVEAEVKLRLASRPYTLDWELRADLTNAQDLSHGESLPRIAPLRIFNALQWARERWTVRGEVDHAARQHRVPASDLLGTTPSYTLIHASLAYDVKFPKANALVFLKAGNLSNKVAYNAGSIDTIRGLAPLPGRNVRAGVQINF